MNKKASNPIAIVLLVVAFFLVIGYARFTFLDRAEEIRLHIQGSSTLEEVYAKESQVNFYIGSIIKTSAREATGNSNPKEAFLTKFKQELENYKVSGRYIIPQLEQIEAQLSEEKIKIDDDSISVSFKIKIDGELEEDNYELLSVEYIYEKEFEEELTN